MAYEAELEKAAEQWAELILEYLADQETDRLSASGLESEKTTKKQRRNNEK